MMLFSCKDNEVPEGAESGVFKTTDGIALRFARWRPEGATRGTVCVFHGRAEKIEKYYETARDLMRRGFAVATLDWRGQGGSERLLRNPMKGHVGDFADYQIDLEAFMREVVLPDCPPPYFALAHSMGASVLLDSVRLGERLFDRMFLAAPMLELSLIKHDTAARRLAKVLNGIGLARAYVPTGKVKRLSELHFDGNRLTSDPARFARNLTISLEHPELDVGPPTIGWLASAFDLLERFADPATVRSIRQPMLIVAAGADRIVSTPAIERFAVRLIAGSHIVIPGARHELLQERDIFREPLFAAFDAFIPGSDA